MKTLILVSVAFFMVNYVSAQKIKESDVPKNVVSAFQAKFKGAKVKKMGKRKR